LLTSHEERLVRMVAFRMDPRLRGRLDACDVVQDAFVQAAAHRDQYFDRPPVPLFLWLRRVVTNKLFEVHRNHLGAHMRDAARDVSLDRAPPRAGDTSAALLAELSGHATGPSAAVHRVEVVAALRAALAAMDEVDREALALRHFEQLTNAEAAAVLGLSEAAAAKRYLRALKRLKDVLAEMPGGLTGLGP
jgi:RNA polymerase sigma-70 factor, ECF subfamily